MADATTRVEPALTPGNWERMEKFPFVIRDGSLCEWTGDGLVEHDQLDGIMALANAALPDAHPGKITRRMVTLCEAAAVACLGDDHYFAGELTDGEPWTPGREKRLADEYRQMAAALRAFLPPEAPGDAD